MSAYAYRLEPGCVDPGNEVKVSDDRAAELQRWLAATTDETTKWVQVPALGMIDERDAAKVGCEDDQGLMFHVWQRKVGAQSHVAIAFRGTSGRGDWW